MQQRPLDRYLDRIEAMLQPVHDQEARARELADHVPHGEFYFGLVGVESLESVELVDDLCVLRPVTNPPGLVHVARAADLRRSDYLTISRYADSIRAELVVRGRERLGVDVAAEVAWHAAALLKLRAAPALLCPACATISWDTVSAVADNSVEFRVWDDVPRRIVLGGALTNAVADADASWVRDHFMDALQLRGAGVSRRFGLAYNLAYTWDHTTDMRVAIANVWAGLEALFGERTDRRIREALASRISTWVAGVDPNEVRRLYDQRCDAVHGRWLREQELAVELKASADLLRGALIESIQRVAVPLPDWA